MSRVVGGAGRIGGGAQLGEEVQVERGPQGPVQFWRGGSRYLVGELLDSWVETGPWWRRAAVSGAVVAGAASSGSGAPGAPITGGASADLVAGREVWRVEAVRAGRSRLSFAGVYDLAWEAAENRWSLVRVHD
jgi:hypothetical protein